MQPNPRRWIREAWRSTLVTYKKLPALILFSETHQAILGLTAFVIIANTLIAQAAKASSLIPSDVILSDSYAVADTVRLLADYTSDIEEDPEALPALLDAESGGAFITSSSLLTTEPSQITPSPEPTTAPADRRTTDTKYTVAIGDTISGIGAKFNLRVASIQVKNNLRDIDTIKPGQELIIPADNLSDKAIQAAKDRATASVKTPSSAVKTISTRSGGFGLVVPLRHNGISRRLVGGHTGIDYRANVGTPVAASADGVIIVADNSGWNGGFGKTILIAHAGNKTTRYGHLSSVSVKQGQRVSQSQVIGLSGNSGRSTGPHLHFELRVNGVAYDPGT